MKHAFDPSDDASLEVAFNRVWHAGIRLGIIVGAVIASTWSAAVYIVVSR